MCRLSRRLRSSCMIAAMCVLISCTHRVSVEAINHEPSRFRDKEITVAGRVANSFTDGSSGAFELDDGTGRLWVFRSDTNLPARNSSVAVSGRIEQGFPFAGRNFVIILRETRRR